MLNNMYEMKQYDVTHSSFKFHVMNTLYVLLNMYHNHGDTVSKASDTAKAVNRRYSHSSLIVYNTINV